MASRFDVYVVPRSPRPGPDGRHGGVPRLRISAPPVSGRANAEVERVLSRLLRSGVRLVGGQKARRKRLETDLDGDSLEQRLTESFGPVV